MTHAVRGLGLAASLMLVSAAAVVPQARAASTSPPAAYVYIQIEGPAGAVYGFSASSTGHLTAISGAPWKPAGEIIGDNKSLLVTMGSGNLHSYGIASNGAIEDQLEQNPDTDYAGGACGNGTNWGAVLDHTGQFVYVLQQNGGNGSCAAYQSFQILSKSPYKGVFDGVGDTEVNTSGGDGVDLPTILGNESFAYADQIDGHYASPIGFRRESSGELQLMQFTETDPTLSDGFYTPYRPDASPAGNYLVLQLFPYDSNPAQLGSYTVDPEGNLSSTNTSSDMPTSPFNNFVSTFSPSGNLFVIYADNGAGPGGNGIQIYKFNAAAPLTPYKTLLSGTPIDQVAWDSSNHLYAISRSKNMLYVFTVTSTSVTEDTSWSIGSPWDMVVVSE